MDNNNTTICLNNFMPKSKVYNFEQGEIIFKKISHLLDPKKHKKITIKISSNLIDTSFFIGFVKSVIDSTDKFSFFSKYKFVIKDTVLQEKLEKRINNIYKLKVGDKNE